MEGEGCVCACGGGGGVGSQVGEEMGEVINNCTPLNDADISV